MINVDILFIYEIKSRELENICLLRYELERRGYSVGIVQKSVLVGGKGHKAKYNTEIVIIPACYDNEALRYFTEGIVNFNKVIDMQWEQVLSLESENNKQSIRFLKEIALKTVHITWGNRNKKRLINICGIDDNYVKKTGHIALDFLRDEFSSYYYNKEDLFTKYNLPLDKKVLLFISSFSYVGLTNSRLQGLKNMIGNDAFEFASLSIQSQKEILYWFEQTLTEDDHSVFIYRPHPAEHLSTELLTIDSKYENFHIIRDHSVKQWIKVSDTIFTWFSTSIAEVFYSKKSCAILRPLEIPYEKDTILTKDAHYINNYKDFKNAIGKDSIEFPIRQTIINDSYYTDNTECTYMKICNVIEDIYSNDEYAFSKSDFINLTTNELRDKNKGIKQMIKTSFIYDIYMWLLSNQNIAINFLEERRKLIEQSKIDEIIQRKQSQDEHDFNHTSDEEIMIILKNIKDALEGGN